MGFLPWPGLNCASKLVCPMVPSDDMILTQVEKSAFGKAAIGKKTAKTLRGRNEKKKLPLREKKTTTLRTATSTKQILKRKDDALLAFKSHLNLDLHSSIQILNAYPRLYTHIPNISDKLEYLLNEINLKPEQLRRMLLSHPRLMEKVIMDHENNLMNTLEILQNELDLSVKDIKAIQSRALPAILTYPRSELRKRILVYKLDLEYPKKEITQMVLKDPRMLRTDSSNVRQILKVLKEELQIGKDNVRDMLRKEILLLTYNAEDNIRPTILYLRDGKVGQCLGMVERKGLSTLSASTKKEKKEIIVSRLKKIIMGNPKVLSSSLEKNLKPTVLFFFQDVGLSSYEFGRVIYRRGGSIFEANLERTLKRKVSFLRSQLDLEIEEEKVGQYIETGEPVIVDLPDPEPDKDFTLSSYSKKRLLAQMIATNPDILTLSIEKNLEPKFNFFRSTLQLSNEQLRYIILRRPQILALSLERNLIPKIGFLSAPRQNISVKSSSSVDLYCGGLGMSMEEIRDWITQYPQTLTFVLESRIKPRVFDVVKYGLDVGDKANEVPFNFITRTDVSWTKWINEHNAG